MRHDEERENLLFNNKKNLDIEKIPGDNYKRIESSNIVAKVSDKQILQGNITELRGSE